MNTYEIKYDYKGYLEEMKVNADDILGAIGIFLENTDTKLRDVICVQGKQ